ncbi:MAG: TadA family conjugal transfer-associated ATPase [Corynebacterium nuruki]|nr:TadA family conjugal transfer-associated ATPase [Corynebacterium nuruki]
MTGLTELAATVREGLVDRGVLQPTPADIAAVLHDRGDHAGVADMVESVRDLSREFSGLGDLAVPLADPTVTDVLVNGPGPVWIDRGRGLETTGLRMRDAHRCRELAVRLATACGVRLDDARPFADGVLTDLPPGVAARAVRVHAVLDPPAGTGTGGACISLRALSASHRSLRSLQTAGLFDAGTAARLRDLVARRQSFLVTGGTGAGKTTLLAALLAEVPADQRILLVEDTPELFPDHPHVVGLRTREATGDGAGTVDMRTLVRQALRMRPDRIVVGEIRGAEIAELLLAFNTGHAGSAGTVHANRPDAVPGRLTALGALAGIPGAAVARQVVDGVDVVLHVDRSGGRRRLTGIGRFVLRRGELTVEPLTGGVPC